MRYRKVKNLSKFHNPQRAGYFFNYRILLLILSLLLLVSPFAGMLVMAETVLNESSISEESITTYSTTTVETTPSTNATTTAEQSGSEIESTSLPSETEITPTSESEITPTSESIEPETTTTIPSKTETTATETNSESETTATSEPANEDTLPVNENYQFSMFGFNADNELSGADITQQSISNNSREYADVFLEAAIFSKVNPIFLARRSIQEVGAGGSDSVSGTVPEYLSIYNYYCIGAYAGTNPITNGLQYAKYGNARKPDSLTNTEKNMYLLPWDNHYDAIVGGANWIGTGYINSGQNTPYYQKWNIDAKHGSLWWHQYMGNIIAPTSESISIFNTYKAAEILNIEHEFSIPVLADMLNEPAPFPSNDKYPLNPSSGVGVDVNLEGKIGVSSVYMRSGPNHNTYGFITQIPARSEIEVLKRVDDGASVSGSKIWYLVRDPATGYVGYVAGALMVVNSEPISSGIVEPTEDPEFEKHLDNEGFPESYRPALRALHKKYPNWKFTASWPKTSDKTTNMSWNTVIAEESKPIRKNSVPRSYSIEQHNSQTSDAGFYYANPGAIAYYLDPRNFLNEKTIFQFLNLSYNPAIHTKLNIEKSLAGSFMRAGIPFPESSRASALMGSTTLNVGSDYITNVEPQKGVHTVQYLRDKLNTPERYRLVISVNGTEVTSGLVGTGTKVSLFYENENKSSKDYYLLIYGDPSGDGEIDSLDIMAVIRYILEMYQPAEIEMLAMDVNADGAVDSVDLMLLVRHILEMEFLNQAK